jgi:DNA-binding transcriptional MerR regulator
VSIDEQLVQSLLQRKKRKSLKTELVQQHREEILALRERGLSLADICAYLEAKYSLSVSPDTLKKAVPEVVNKVQRVARLISSLSCSELKQVASYVQARIEKCRQAFNQASNQASDGRKA